MSNMSSRAPRTASESAARTLHTEAYHHPQFVQQPRRIRPVPPWRAMQASMMMAVACGKCFSLVNHKGRRPSRSVCGARVLRSRISSNKRRRTRDASSRARRVSKRGEVSSVRARGRGCSRLPARRLRSKSCESPVRPGPAWGAAAVRGERVLGSRCGCT